MRLAGKFMRKEEQEVTECHQTSSGLYQPEYEHDACGVGMIVDIHGNKSHELVDAALKVLENMKHRGAEGADNKTGDGAGIMCCRFHMSLYCYKEFRCLKRGNMVRDWFFFRKTRRNRSPF